MFLPKIGFVNPICLYSVMYVFNLVSIQICVSRLLSRSDSCICLYVYSQYKFYVDLCLYIADFVIEAQVCQEEFI